jgi:hypothetical protein
VYDNACTTHVTTAGDHSQISGVEFYHAGDLTLCEVEPDGVVHFDKGIGVTNCTPIVSDNVGNAPVAESDLLHLEKFVCSLLRGDPVDNKAALYIIKQAEVLGRLFDGENI